MLYFLLINAPIEEFLHLFDLASHLKVAIDNILQMF